MVADRDPAFTNHPVRCFRGTWCLLHMLRASTVTEAERWLRSVWGSAVLFYGPGAVHERNVPDQQRGERLCLMYWSRHGAVGSERSEPHSSPPSRRRRWRRCAFHHSLVL